MKVIYIEYARHGNTVSDWETDEIVERVKTAINHLGGFFSFSSFIAIDAIRAAIARKEIDNQFVVFLYKNEQLKPDKHGRIDKWPDEGFGGPSLKFMEDIVMATLCKTIEEQNEIQGDTHTA